MLIFSKVFVITFIIVLIFRKANDASDLEVDPDDDGSPIYIDKKIQDVDKYLEDMKVYFLNKIIAIKPKI